MRFPGECECRRWECGDCDAKWEALTGELAAHRRALVKLWDDENQRQVPWPEWLRSHDIDPEELE